MKVFVLLLSLLIFQTFLATQGEAAFVHYTDANGKIQYVNTEYGKIPDKYLNQVQNQMNNIEKNTAATPIPAQDETGTQIQNTASTEKITVEVFFKNDCLDCQRLQILLDANKIKYKPYNVETAPHGIEFYKNMNNVPLPITRIGSKFIVGNDITAIRNALISGTLTNPAPTIPLTNTTVNQNKSNETDNLNPTMKYRPGEVIKTQPLTGQK